jgi:hypothetical protein
MPYNKKALRKEGLQKVGFLCLSIAIQQDIEAHAPEGQEEYDHHDHGAQMKASV